MEALPALGPVVGHLLPAHPHAHPADLRFPVGQRRQLPGRPVDRVLHDTVAVDLLDARGRQLDQRGEHELGPLRRSRDGESDQRSARFSFETIDSLAGSLRFSSVIESRRRSSRSRCSALRLRGTITFSTTC